MKNIRYEDEKMTAIANLLKEICIDVVGRDAILAFESTDRFRDAVIARQFFCAALIHYSDKKRVDLSLSEIGSLVYKQKKIDPIDHSTVLHAKKTIANLCETNYKIKCQFRNILNRFYDELDAKIVKGASAVKKQRLTFYKNMLLRCDKAPTRCKFNKHVMI